MWRVKPPLPATDPSSLRTSSPVETYPALSGAWAPGRPAPKRAARACGRATPPASITPGKSPPPRNAAHRGHRRPPRPACCGSAEPPGLLTVKGATGFHHTGAGQQGCRGLARLTALQWFVPTASMSTSEGRTTAAKQGGIASFPFFLPFLSGWLLAGKLQLKGKNKHVCRVFPKSCR